MRGYGWQCNQCQTIELSTNIAHLDPLHRWINSPHGWVHMYPSNKTAESVGGSLSQEYSLETVGGDFCSASCAAEYFSQSPQYKAEQALWDVKPAELPTDEES